jgi:hypothetical protein
MSIPSKKLSRADQTFLSGYPDINRIEPDQVYQQAPPVIPPEMIKPSEKIEEVRGRAQQCLIEIKRLEDLIDGRCTRFSVTTEKNSRLFQAMFRVFGEKTTTVTYNHYKKALELREQLAKEGTEKLRKS